MANTDYLPGPDMLLSPSADETRRAFALGVFIKDGVEQDRDLFGPRLHPVAMSAGIFHFVHELAITDPAYARDLAWALKTTAATLHEMIERRVIA